MSKLKPELWLTDTATLIALCTLSLISFKQFESNIFQNSEMTIVLLAFLKFLLIYLLFMRMISASKYWHFLTVFYLLIIGAFALIQH